MAPTSKPNAAQLLRAALGVEAPTETTGKQRSASATKAGPGRRHASISKAKAVKQRGAPLGFVQHVADPAKKLRRANVKALGRRQALKAAKRERREPLPAGLIDAMKTVAV